MFSEVGLFDIYPHKSIPLEHKRKMLLNEHIALVTPHILLVPYSPHHVPTYHEWMKDEELQTLTASEPLSLPEEHSMQQSWRQDNDKLTFISCLPPSTSLSSINPQHHDAPDRMIGDINLFLVPFDSDSSSSSSDGDQEVEKASKAKVVGEVEIMIAVAAYQRKGYGRAALNAFIQYIRSHLRDILMEFTGVEDAELVYLRVKIGKENQKSVALFRSVGFVDTGAGPNYFGEVELRLEREMLGGVAEGNGVMPEIVEYML